jgi:ankyrin repeat protein
VGGGAPLLHTAASVGQRAVVRVLLDAGADPNIVSSFGSNALGATMWGSRNMFDLEGGPAARPLTEIPQEGFVAVARLLLAAGADVPKTLASDEVQAVIDQR